MPHGKLTAVDSNILTVVGEIDMPLMKLPRRMTVVRVADGRLIVFSAIALDDDEMAALEAFGRLTWLIVPNDRHRLDARIWKDRYPAMQVIAPEGSRDAVGETVQVDSVTPDFADPNVQFVTVPGTRGREAALVVGSNQGTTLVLNDVVANIRDAAGFGGWLLRIAGFAGDEAHVPKVVRMAMIKDADALRAQLLEWSDIASLKRVLVSHGAPIEDDPRAVLRQLAIAL
jgi:hypothetical protein